MKRKINFKEKLEKLENFLFDPHVCICCNYECDLDNNYRLCSKCVDKLNFIGNQYCLKCGDKIGDGYDFCINCKETSYNFDCSRSVICYDEISSPIIQRFKYNGQKMYAIPLAYMLNDYYAESDITVNAVTYVPMPKDRQKERGYNQAEELAKEFCKLTKLPLFDLLTRKTGTTKQSTLTAKERRENIKGNFTLINKAKVKNKDILLIDDVSTTGSTTNVCAKVLMKGGARTVSVLTVCKTPREYNMLKEQ